jgi:RNA methyltransferase, TrmH family
MISEQNISSSNNQNIKLARNLMHNVSIRKTHTLFCVEGEHFIFDLIDTNSTQIKYLIIKINYSKHNKLRNILKAINIPLYIVEEAIFKKISSVKTSHGIIAVVKKPEWDINNIIKNYANITLLDQIQNPANFGAIVRNAAAFNIDAVLYTKNSVDPFHPESIRAMAGNIYKTPIIECDEALFNSLQKPQTSCYILDSNADTSLSKINLNKRNIFILGSEGHGIKSDFIKKTSSIKKLKIDMPGNIDSLNVAVSSGILFYKLGTVAK